MPTDAYLALAFGGGNTEHCDMLLFQSDMASPSASDCYYEVSKDEFIDE